MELKKRWQMLKHKKEMMATERKAYREGENLTGKKGKGAKVMMKDIKPEGK